MLLLTALAKLYSAGGGARILQIQDQLLHLGYRRVMVLAALFELATAALLVWNRSDLRRSLMLLWLSSNLIAYHLGNFLLGVHTCPCLGQVADRLPLPRGMADVMLQLLVLWWFLGSWNSFWRLWGSERWSRIAASPRRFFGNTSALGQ
ncbi:MAG TPA: hypothetical protein VG146_22665 [Verrucomicrobiae bacterium]|nr:hypothetical protein [Verrucomicrobiae bacterium]